jgi:rSAM/selenodomain-associated transferase 2
MISVVIPVLNESRIIGSCLSRLQQETTHHEIVVVDGGSQDGTREIVKTFPNVKILDSPTGRGRQMNRGASAARGNTLLFLHADTLLPPGGLLRIEKALGQHKDIVAGSFSLTFDYPSPFLRLYARFSRINHILFTYGDQGFFMSKHIFQEIGGFLEIPIMEDVEIQKRLNRLGRFVKIRQPVKTSARRFLFHGIIKQQLLNAALVFMYHSGVSPFKLKRFYGQCS